MYILAGLYVLTIIAQNCASYELPSCVTPCKRYDRNLSKCWRSNIEKMRMCPKGLTNLNISSIDPWISQAVVIFDTIEFYVVVTNIVYSGTKNFIILDNYVNLAGNLISLTVHFPNINHTFITKANGSMFNLPFNNEESCAEGSADLTVICTLKGKRVWKNGNEHISFNHVSVVVHSKNYRQQVYNFIVGPPKLDKLFGVIIDKNPDVFHPLYNKFAKDAIGSDIAKLITHVYDVFPLNILHPL